MDTIWCKHFRSMVDHDTCKAGVAYNSLRGIPWMEHPCFARKGDTDPRPGCSLAVLPTIEEQEAEDRKARESCERIGTARKAIVESLGGPWKRGMPGSRGCIACPVCGQPDSLHFTRAGYNGHIHAKCKTQGCVSWME